MNLRQMLVFVTVTAVVLCVDVMSEKFHFSVHVIDTGKGRSASELPVKLFKLKNTDYWILVSQGKTEANGRMDNFTSTGMMFTTGTYKLSFGVKDYYGAMGQKTFFPTVDVIFDIEDTRQHYHIPLLLNAFGYSTYRGS